MAKVTRLVSIPTDEMGRKLTVQEQLNRHESLISDLQDFAEVPKKIWQYLKYMTPAIVVSLIASMSEESAGYKFLSTMAHYFGFVK